MEPRIVLGGVGLGIGRRAVNLHRAGSRHGPRFFFWGGLQNEWCSVCFPNKTTKQMHPRKKRGNTPNMIMETRWRNEVSPTIAHHVPPRGRRKIKDRVPSGSRETTLPQSWKLTGGLWKTMFLLRNIHEHFHDCTSGKQTLAATCMPGVPYPS